MVVELKKVKITKSIFNQLTGPLLDTDSKYEVLGWVFDKGKYILLYNKETNSLAKMRTFSNLSIDPKMPNCALIAVNGLNKLKSFPTGQDALNWCAKINIIQTEANLKGQLYI
ncbi:hypothetical protein [Sphingobacterium sp. JUb56]|uniref:hypothetical protein n=1 Tax=Sphingobacterium sp. JUb56 TaxID=2587145 RepID=UPI001613824B|nr:hypothetical protein [Sphingobacterium sp. JUb56]MBB2951993.1 hypothetical protein [Sphingobacterium sp. JUb56]